MNIRQWYFFPSYFTAFFCIYKEEKSSKGCVFTVIGLTGLLQTHILSCEMIGFIILVFCMILWKKTFQPKRFLVLAKTVVYTVIVNLWFLVPFLDYMQGSYRVTEATEDKIQTSGVFISQLVSIFPNAFGEMGNNELIPGENIVVIYYNKVWIYCENNSQERGEIEVPLLYYKGYAACDDTSGEKLEVGPGTNNQVKIVLQPGYKGSIELKFAEPMYWRIAEIISLVFIAGTAVCYIRKIRRK